MVTEVASKEESAAVPKLVPDKVIVRDPVLGQLAVVVAVGLVGQPCTPVTVGPL